MQMPQDNGRFVVGSQYADAETVEVKRRWDIKQEASGEKGLLGQ